MIIHIEGTPEEIVTFVRGLEEGQGAHGQKAEDCLRAVAPWTGNLVGLMHNNRISNAQLAKELNVTDRYVSMVLNGHRDPPGAEERFTAAVHKIIARRNDSEGQEVTS